MDRKIQAIKIAEISTGDKRRQVNWDAVESIRQSIAKIGLQTPITVAPSDGNGFDLVTGRHRMEAFLKEDKKTIPAFVMLCEPWEAELWEIDENLCRSELSEIEEARCLKRRKEIFEGRGGRTSSTPGGQQRVGFASDTAEATGKSKQHINVKVARAEAVAPDVLEDLQGTEHDKGVVLDALKPLSHDEQRQAANRMKGGETVGQAVSFITGEDPDVAISNKAYSKLISAWNSAPESARQRFRDFIDSPVFDKTNAAR